MIGRLTVYIVLSVRLSRDQWRVDFIHLIIPSLLFGKVNGLFLSLELHGRALHVISRRRPAHKRVLPSTGGLKIVPVNSPVVDASPARLHRRLCRLVDSDSSVVEAS